jgi:hypothetical protein
MRDHRTIEIRDFRGLFDRGLPQATPQDHFLQCDNIRFLEHGVATRPGTDLTFNNITNIRRVALYKRPGEATRMLILDSNGNLYDSTSPASPILQIPEMVDFRMHVFFGRAYITPLHSSGVGLPGSFLYVYDGTGVARKAAGTRPSGTLTANESSFSGNVEAGYHLYAVAFETISGFITKPGPANYAILESSGGFQVELSGIPQGPAGTTKRHILATKSILNYDGNQEGYEFFFVPGGTIPNNNPVGQFAVNFFDADLVSSAEYLFDQYEEIPAGTGITEYRGRLILWDQNYLYVSRPGEPESIDALSGLVLVGPGEPSYIQDCVEYRDLLYVHKKYRSFVTTDNGQDPGTWPVSAIDKGLGSPLRGIIQILDAQGSSVDKFLVATYRGLVLFDGIYREPELSYKIENVWRRINSAYFHLVHGVVDTKHHEIFITVPLDSSTTCSHILYADYSRGLDPANIRWSIWSSSAWQPTSLIIDISQDVPYLRIGSTAGVFSVDRSLNTDEGQAITSTIRTGLLPQEMTLLNHFGAIRGRMSGSGSLSIELNDEDFTRNFTTSIALNQFPGQDLTILTNLITERASIEFTSTSPYTIERLNLFLSPIWNSR